MKSAGNKVLRCVFYKWDITTGGCAALTHPTLNVRPNIVGRVSAAHPPPGFRRRLQRKYARAVTSFRSPFHHPDIFSLSQIPGRLGENPPRPIKKVGALRLPTLQIVTSSMWRVLLRLKKIGRAVSPQAGTHRRDPVQGHDNTGTYCLARPVAGGKKAGLSRRGDFLPGAGIAKGRRRAPFARSREKEAHINAALWRTEPFHHPDIINPTPSLALPHLAGDAGHEADFLPLLVRADAVAFFGRGESALRA